MHHAPLPEHIARLVAQLNANLRELHDAGDEVVLAVAHVTTPGEPRALSQLHVDRLAPDIPADVAVLPIARPALARTA